MTLDPILREQLCAWLDGELPADQRRFLERRLARDPQLREQVGRWRLAADCLRGERVLALPGCAEAIAAAVAAEPPRRGAWPWLATAAAIALVAVLMPATPVRPPANTDVGTLATSATARAPLPGEEPAVRSPAPLDVRDLPLAESAQLRPWPRSPLPQAGDGPLVVRAERLLPPTAAPAPSPPEPAGPPADRE